MVIGGMKKEKKIVSACIINGTRKKIHQEGWFVLLGQTGNHHWQCWEQWPDHPHPIIRLMYDRVFHHNTYMYTHHPSQDSSPLKSTYQWWREPFGTHLHYGAAGGPQSCPDLHTPLLPCTLAQGAATFQQPANKFLHFVYFHKLNCYLTISLSTSSLY